MQFSFNRKDILTAVKKAARIAKSESPIKELTGILLIADADNYELSITATDMESTIKLTQSVAVSEAGGAIVNAALFHEFLNQFNADVVQCKVLTNGQMQLICGDSECVIPTLPPKNYPKIEFSMPQKSVKISGIAGLCKKSVFAVSKENDNLALKCVKITIDQNSANAIACDGTRMISTSKPLISGGDLSLLVPAHSLSKLASLMADDGEMEVGISGKNAVFSKEGFVFSTRLVDAVYVDVDVMLSSMKPMYEAVVGAKSLSTAIETVTAVGGENPLNMVFQLGSINLGCEGESGKSHMNVNAQTSIPTPSEGFHFQHTKLLQSLKSMDGNIKIELSAQGMMLITTDTQKYLQVSVRPSIKKKAAKKSKKTASKAA